MDLDGPADIDETAVAHVRRGYRRMRVATWVFGLVIAAVAAGLHPHIAPASPFPRVPLPVVVVLGAGIVLSYLPVVRVGNAIEFRTDDPPDAVRESFLGGVNPLTVRALALADDGGIDVDGARVTTETTRFAGLHTTRISCETGERPDGDLVVRSVKNGGESAVARVSIRAEEGETRVRIDASRGDRISPRTLALHRIQEAEVRRAWAELGYEVVAAKSSVGVPA